MLWLFLYALDTQNSYCQYDYENIYIRLLFLPANAYVPKSLTYVFFNWWSLYVCICMYVFQYVTVMSLKTFPTQICTVEIMINICSNQCSWLLDRIEIIECVVKGYNRRKASASNALYDTRKQTVTGDFAITEMVIACNHRYDVVRQDKTKTIIISIHIVAFTTHNCMRWSVHRINSIFVTYNKCLEVKKFSVNIFEMIRQNVSNMATIEKQSFKMLSKSLRKSHRWSIYLKWCAIKSNLCIYF